MTTHLNLLGEGGGEHERLPSASGWHALLLHYATDLRLKAHVKHTVSLVQSQVPHHGEGDLATLKEVHQPETEETTARSGEQKKLKTWGYRGGFDVEIS